MLEIFEELFFLSNCKFVLIGFHEFYGFVYSIMRFTFKNSGWGRLYLLIIIYKLDRFYVILISLMKDS